MRKLRIAQVSPLWYPVPPKGYGGTELIVSRLTEELIKKGHDVTLFATGNSETKAKLVSVVKQNLYSLKIPWLSSDYNILNLIEAFSQQKKFDIIHTHIDKLDCIFRSQSKTATIATLHNPIWPIRKENVGEFHNYQAVTQIYNRFPKLPYIAISNSYKKNCPAKINFTKTVYNGIYPQQFKFIEKPEDYFVWFGRITHLKGPQIAIKLAKKMGLKLMIAGFCASPKTIDFFNREIKPHLSKKIKFLGEIKSNKDKTKLLGNAKALIYPLLWDEPFGIVMAESQACGTPVIVFDRGSAKEVVKHGKTGFVVKNTNEMIKAIKNIDKIDRKECRKYVEENFTVKKMVDGYEKAYYEVINKFNNL